jgi:hypothetical protein
MKSDQSDYEDVAACLISFTSSGGLTPKIKKKVQKGQSESDVQNRGADQKNKKKGHA